MKIVLTFNELHERCNDWEEFCEEVGLNPWCLNEGLADGDEEYSINEEVAKKYGMIE